MTRRETKERLFQGYLRGCYETVKDAVSAGDCESLRDLHFWKNEADGESHCPDYKNPTTVAYYQLRFACGYAFEYYCAYRIALDWLREAGEEDVSAVSLGCGSGLDRYSLELAVIDSNFGNKCYFDIQKQGTWIGDERRWVGVDIANWGKPFKITSKGFPTHDNVIQVFPGGATEYFQNISKSGKTCNSNIFFFPRILSELSTSAIDDLAGAISNASFSSNRFIVCIANRTGYEGSDEHSNSQQIINAFRSKGSRSFDHVPGEILDSIFANENVQFESEEHDDGSPCYRLIDSSRDGKSKSVKIRDLDIGGFMLPRDIWNYLSDKDGISDLRKNCPDLSEDCNKECADVEEKKGRRLCPLSLNPVTTASQMSLQIIMVERNGR